MIDVIPAILTQSYGDLKNKVALVRGVVSVVQVDICDGKFVKNKTWPFTSGDSDFDFLRILNEEEGMPFWQDLDYELDLMVIDAVENFDLYCKLSPKRIIFHLEAVGDIRDFKNFLEGMDVYIRDSIEIGVAINTTTNVEQLFPLINYLDFVQCMGIEQIGFQGQDFDKRVVEKIKALKEKYEDLIISVDGGVNLDTAQVLLGAGADRLTVGSYLFNSDDIRGTISELESLV